MYVLSLERVFKICYTDDATPLACHQSLLCAAERSLYYSTLVESAAKFKLLTALLFRAQATASFKTVNGFFMCLTAEFQISVIVLLFATHCCTCRFVSSRTITYS